MYPIKLVLCLGLLSCALSTKAADIYGTVSAASRAIPIVNANVILQCGDQSRQTTSDHLGAFLFPDVTSPAPCTLEVKANGFESFRREAWVPNQDNFRLDVHLTFLGLQQSVQVTDRVLALHSEEPELSQSIESQELEELPSNGRSLNRFALLDPHVRSAYGLGGDGNAAYRLSINAGSYRNTSYMLDGTINYDWIYANGPMMQVSVGSTQEFKVVNTSASAQYGVTTTGTLEAVTRSGTNALHGEAFGFFRPSGIQANSPLTPFHTPNEREQWGADLGGPLKKDRTFYFASYEGIHQNRGAYIQSPVPDFFDGIDNEYYGLARLDHQFSDNHNVTLRLNGFHYANNNPNDRVSGYFQPSYGRIEKTQSLGGQLTDHYTSGQFVNEFRATVASFFPDSAFPLNPSVGITRPSYSTSGLSTTSWVHAQLTDLGDNVTVARGAHTLKFGLNAVRVTARDYSNTPYGSYTFAAGPPTPDQQPLNYSQTFGVSNITWGDTYFGAFAQDDWKVRPGLTVNLGLRYEYQSVTNALHNLAPRLGLTWDITGDHKTILRAGAGMFYDQLYLYVYRRFYSLGPSSPQMSYTIPYGAAGFPTFPESLIQPPTGTSAGRLNLYVPSSHMVNPYSLQYTLGVERDLGHQFVLSVDGLYEHTLKQYRVNDINHPAPFIRTAAGQVRSGTAADATRPLLTYQGVPVRDLAVIENSSSSIYSSLDVGLRRRFASRFSFEGHYVLSSSASYSMFYADANSGIPNEWNNWGPAERAPSDFFQHHRFVGNGAVDLPWRSRVDFTATAASGLPVNPITGTDNNGDTYTIDRPVGFGRNSFRTPMNLSFDLAVAKQIQIAEHARLETRIEFFNILNHNNYLTVNNVYGEGPVARSTFLQPIAGIGNVDPSRQIQFGIKLLF